MGIRSDSCAPSDSELGGNMACIRDGNAQVPPPPPPPRSLRLAMLGMFTMVRGPAMADFARMKRRYVICTEISKHLSSRVPVALCSRL